MLKNSLRLVFCFILAVACKTAKAPASPPEFDEPIPMPEPQATASPEPEPVPKETNKTDTAADSSAGTRTPLPSVEGTLNIADGVIWAPDLSRCLRPGSNKGFRFCSGGVHANVLLPQPDNGSGKVRFTLSFNCASFPAQNALTLAVGSESKVVLASVLTDSPIFSSEIPVQSGIEKKISLDFSPNYSATYPPDCRLMLLENKLVSGAG